MHSGGSSEKFNSVSLSIYFIYAYIFVVCYINLLWDYKYNKYLKNTCKLAFNHTLCFNYMENILEEKEGSCLSFCLLYCKVFINSIFSNVSSFIFCSCEIKYKSVCLLLGFRHDYCFHLSSWKFIA